MELLVESHSNVKDFAEGIGHLMQSDSEKALLDKFKGILIVIPEDLLIVKSREKSSISLNWTDLKEAIVCSFRSMDSSSPAKTSDLKWLRSGEYGLNVNLLNLLEDEKWELLYEQLGEGAVSKILMKCQLFLPLSGTSYIPLYSEKAVRNINTVQCKSQFTKSDKKELTTLDLNPILYGKNSLSPLPAEVGTHAESYICDKLVGDILEQDVGGGKLKLEPNAMLCLKGVVRSLIQRCSKNKTYSFILKNIYIKNKGSGPSSSPQSKPTVKEISEKSQSCSEIRSVALRKRRKKKPLLQEIPLRSVKKSISFHLNKIIPEKMFSKQKPKVIRNLLKVLKYGKNQCFLLEEILDNISIGKIPCVKKCVKKEAKTRLLAKLVAWLMLKWVFPLIGLDFYVTEKQNGFNKLHFYKKTLFKRLIFSTVVKLKKKDILRALKSEQILDKHNDVNRSHGLFRLIPKGKFDVRHVIWNKVKNPLLEETMIFYKQLTSITVTNFGTDTKNNFYAYWTKLIGKWNEDGCYPLYFVKVDVSDAYGSVILMKLKRIIQKFVKPLVGDIRSLTLRKYKCFTMQSMGFRCFYLWRFEELPPSVPAHSIIVPTSVYKVFEVNRLLFVTYIQILMKDLKIGEITYLIKRGIPHAGKLSASFCQIYYDELDKKCLSEFTKNENEIFFRAVDDYLYVTPSHERAKRFLQKMMHGFKDFGVSINLKKTLTNFGENSSEIIPFYGFMLNTKTMEVSAKYEIYSKTGIFYTMSFKNRSNPGRILKERMKNINCIKLDKIILNPNINRKSTILLGIFRAATLMSFRFNAIVANLFKQYNSHYLVYCVNTSANCISSRVSRLTIPAFGEPPIVSFEESRWMALRAFILNLSRHSCYNDVVNILKCQLRTCSLTLSLEQIKYVKQVIKSNKQNPFKGTY